MNAHPCPTFAKRNPRLLVLALTLCASGIETEPGPGRPTTAGSAADAGPDGGEAGKGEAGRGEAGRGGRGGSNSPKAGTGGSKGEAGKSGAQAGSSGEEATAGTEGGAGTT